jgi:hypothetical protein
MYQKRCIHTRIQFAAPAGPTQPFFFVKPLTALSYPLILPNFAPFKDAMMEMVMEMSGSMGIVDKILNYTNNPTGLLGLGKDILDATEQIGDAWTGFRASLTKGQQQEMDKKGFSFMDKKQLAMFYGKDGINTILLIVFETRAGTLAEAGQIVNTDGSMD